MQVHAGRAYKPYILLFLYGSFYLGNFNLLVPIAPKVNHNFSYTPFLSSKIQHMTSQTQFTASHTRSSNKNQLLRYFKAVYPTTKVKKVQLELNGAIRSQKVNAFDATTGCDLDPWCEVHDDFKNLMNSWNVKRKTIPCSPM